MSNNKQNNSNSHKDPGPNGPGGIKIPKPVNPERELEGPSTPVRQEKPSKSRNPISSAKSDSGKEGRNQDRQAKNKQLDGDQGDQKGESNELTGYSSDHKLSNIFFEVKTTI